MASYHNIERRIHRQHRLDAAYRGWDASGRFWFVGKGGQRGSLWWANIRDDTDPTIYGATLREISELLAVTRRYPNPCPSSERATAD